MHFLALTISMSTFLLTLLGLAAGSALQCAVHREIAPCTCRIAEPVTAIHVTCERMHSFQQVRETLAGKFPPETEVYLQLGQSEFKDMGNHSFSELGFIIVNLKLNFDTLEKVPASSFLDLKRPKFLSLADNALEEIPSVALGLMPGIQTLDIARNRLRTVRAQDFALSRDLKHLVLASNELDTLEHGAWPRKLRNLHLGRNELRTLNGTLRELADLEWLFLNGNQLDSLENQLPIKSDKLILFHAGHNRLDSLPVEFRSYLGLDTLFLQHNALRGLGGALQHTRRLKRLILEHNLIHELSEDEFSELEILEELNLSHNRLTSLNGSLTPLRRLRCLNLTSNHLHEFSLNDIRGLRRLHIVDLSHNRLTKLTGRIEQNVVESETRVMELRLEHNALQSLDGFLMGLHGLLTLNLSHNQLAYISPDDLIGLEKLTVLDISFNRLTTLEETSKTFLPSLVTLYASHNILTTLEYEFHGLPVLCLADLSYNDITFIGPKLADKTRCRATGGRETLNVYIQGNPVACAGNLTETLNILNFNQAELHGLAPVCPTPAPPVLPLLQMVNASAAVLEVLD